MILITLWESEKKTVSFLNQWVVKKPSRLALTAIRPMEVAKKRFAPYADTISYVDITSKVILEMTTSKR